jgi:hypothetical protein
LLANAAAAALNQFRRGFMPADNNARLPLPIYRGAEPGKAQLPRKPGSSNAVGAAVGAVGGSSSRTIGACCLVWVS